MITPYTVRKGSEHVQFHKTVAKRTVHMDVMFVFVISILAQLAAAIWALRLIPITGSRKGWETIANGSLYERLIPITGSRKAWILISAALLLMTARRCISLFHWITGTLVHLPDLSAEWVALTTSLLFMVGINRIAPLFLSIRQSAEVVRSSERKYRSLFEDSRDAIFVIDQNDVLTDVNKAALELFGYPREEIIGKHIWELYVHPEDRSSFQQEIEQQGYVRDYETKLRKKDGTEIECLLTSSLQRDTDGNILGYQGIIRDITQRKQMEEDLCKKNEILNAILGASSIGISLVRNGVFEWVNNAMCSMLGYEQRSLVGMNTRMVYPDDQEYERVGKELYSEIGTEVNGCIDTRMLHRNGTVFHCHLRTRHLDPQDLSKGQILAAVDITERKRMEESLKESEERYRRFFEEDLTGDYVATVRGQVLECNLAFASIFGFSSVEEAISSDINTIYPDSEARKNFLELLGKERKLAYHETELRRKDGKPVYVIQNAIGIFDEQGELSEVKGYIFDNTEHKKLEDQLRQSQRLEVVGKLAGGVAHDFNNMLTAIVGYSQFALSRLASDDPVRKYVEEIKKAGDRAASLTRQLLAFSRKQILQPKTLNLNAVVTDMEKLLRRLIGEDIQLVTVLGENLGLIKVDPGQIEQVIMNLAVNARDAMPEGGKLTIETMNVELSETYARHYLDVKAGPYVMLAVSDTGIGMEESVRAHVFEPFFTTKELGKGTGLGLATVFGIIKQSEGHIWVYSEPGMGTTFKIYLPQIEASSESVLLKPSPAQISRGSETILLVEDEEIVRKMIAETFHANGYNILEASRGDQAIQICEQYDGRIHLLVTDVVMPGMNGRDLAERLISMRSDMKVVFISGYTDRGVIDSGILDGNSAFLQKPFTPEGLSRKVREVLEPSSHEKVSVGTPKANS